MVIMTRHMLTIHMEDRNTPPEPVMNKKEHGPNALEYYNREMRAYCEREAHHCAVHKNNMEAAAQWETRAKEFESMCHYY